MSTDASSSAAVADASVARALRVKGAVTAGALITIPAPVDDIWPHIVAIDEWSSWYHSIKNSRSRARAIGVGTKFSFQTGPASINATVDVLVAPSEFRFTGRSPGAIATYAFKLDGDGSATEVAAAQSMGGLTARTMRPMLQRVADKSVVTWLDALCERVTAA